MLIHTTPVWQWELCAFDSAGSFALKVM